MNEISRLLGTAILQLVEIGQKEVPSQTDQDNAFATPEKSKDSREAQEEQISPSTLEAAQILTNVAFEGFKGSQAPLGSKIYRRKPKSTPTPTKILHFEEPAETQVNTGSTPSAKLIVLKLTTDRTFFIVIDRMCSKDEKEKIMNEEAFKPKSDSCRKEFNKEEREQYSIEDRAKFLHETIAAQRKFLAEQRYAAIKNKPPTISQLRNQMIMYLNNVAIKKHAELKSKSFEEIQVLYERYKKQDQTFVAIGSEEDERAIKKMNEKDLIRSEGLICP
ncbi:hypothetical protein Tco_1110622 [Tanacetum coccineum]|uniref:Uncharacterized protein n=1 Tax=Tanacetum coccineum TaxID=301880 RepID=A0ABQ5ILV7_9ASTR